MNRKRSRSGAQSSDLAWMAIGLIVGGSLRLLGTPMLVVLLLAGMAGAHGFGWRVIVIRRNGRRTIDV